MGAIRIGVDADLADSLFGRIHDQYPDPLERLVQFQHLSDRLSEHLTRAHQETAYDLMQGTHDRTELSKKIGGVVYRTHFPDEAFSFMDDPDYRAAYHALLEIKKKVRASTLRGEENGASPVKMIWNRVQVIWDRVVKDKELTHDIR